MDITTKTGTCSTCPYWKHTPEVKHVVKPAIKEKNRPREPAVTAETGLCYFEPPRMQLVPTFDPVTRQQGAAMQRFFPNMIEDEFCSHHPARVLDREMTKAAACAKAMNSIVEFSPHKYGDAHAGFNTAPSLEAAKAAAVTFQQCSSVKGAKQCELSNGHKGPHFIADASGLRAAFTWE